MVMVMVKGMGLEFVLSEEQGTRNFNECLRWLVWNLTLA